MNFRIFVHMVSFFLVSTYGLMAQNEKKQLDLFAIRAMEGCFDVSFQYTETFAPEVDYEKAYDYTSSAFEWAEIIEESDDKIVIQHLLIINDSVIIKHWRQDWVYEAAYEFSYNKDYRWTIADLIASEVKGKWTQYVYQVDDSPRYSGTATWTHVDGVSSWYHKADSPLPRREFSKRSDYNVMKRGNRVSIMPYGWLHEQDNDKIIRSDEGDKLLVQEKGYNTYKRRPDSDCASAQKWWNHNHEVWANVREIWEEKLGKSTSIKLHKRVDDKSLYEILLQGSEVWDRAKLESVINKYLIP